MIRTRFGRSFSHQIRKSTAKQVKSGTLRLVFLILQASVLNFMQPLLPKSSPQIPCRGTYKRIHNVLAFFSTFGAGIELAFMCVELNPKPFTVETTEMASLGTAQCQR